MTITAKFTRRKENFTCAVCETHVQGDGYTDHCPECLSSKHVDINPGDRASDCGGVMLAVSLERQNGKDYICYECEKCGYEHRNKVSPNDNINAIIALSNGTIEQYRQALIERRYFEKMALKDLQNNR